MKPLKPFKFFTSDEDKIIQHQADMVIYEEGWEASNDESYVEVPYYLGSREYDLFIEGFNDRCELRQHIRRTIRQ
jgi:hypothetical protein